MGHHIIHEYLKQNPTSDKTELINLYTYFKFKAYLQTTMRFTRKAYCIKLFKNAGILSLLPPDELYKLSDSVHTPSANDLSIDLNSFVDQLEPLQADVIKLYFFEGKTDLEISQMRNVTRQATNNLKRRALRNLGQLLSDSAWK